jgi:4-amino-4-deoxy-L-arabinose transferase-like glycosyltransferase
MSTTAFASVAPARALPTRRAGALATQWSWPWERLSLLAILVLSAVLELWHLDQLGTSNAFYAAAVLSMTQNLHAFFFNSLDSVGFVTIDKPPLGFWIQAVSARLLGFSGFSILLPEALATTGSVALLFYLVKRAFGSTAGLLAGLMLALVPISVVVGRNNTIDAPLVFTLLLSVWTALKATERGSLKWLLATGAIVGLGFEIKMLEAYLVVPALGLVYLLGAPISRRARLMHLALASGMMLAVSLAWPVAVDLTPATLRPWVDSTQNNSAVSLALGYNGIQRLLGQNESIVQFLSGLGLKFSGSDTTSASAGFGVGGMFDNGAAGPLRLLDQQLAGQASWLLPLSALGVGMGAWQAVRQRAAFVHSRRGQATLVFSTWLLAAGGFFSVANFFHSYYLVTLGPPIAALAAIGVTSLWDEVRARSRVAWLLPAALVGTAVVQAYILSYYSSWSERLAPLVVVGTLAGAAALSLCLARPDARYKRVVARVATGVAIVALLIAPAVWSGYSSLYASGGGLPSAGPQVSMSNARFAGAGSARPGNEAQSGGAAFGGAAGGGPGGEASSELVSYLEANQGSATYLVATTDSNTAASIILASDQPVMSLGGFTGSDPILTVDQFASLVEAGEVRYVLVNGGGFGGPQDSGTSAIMNWVKTNGTLVSSAALSTSGRSQTQLYDLGGLTAA